MSNTYERLQKVIAKSGVTSRRKAEKLIIEGKVKVNSKVVTELGTKVGPDDKIEVEGIQLEKEPPAHYLLYKPRGVISSVKDDKGRKVVTDYFPEIEERIYPIGRLDYDTSGILLLTNDGEFANRLMHPKYGVEKVYVAKIKGIPSKMELSRLKKGIKDKNDILKVNNHHVISTDKKKNTTIIELTLREGKNRHVRRMMEQLGYPVLKLKRERYGMLTLDGLRVGEYRKITPKEVKQMINISSQIVED
ncbi:pseudouridine synthase [Paucisalibacillus globulus]|uniref:pseudouridine synthase n=1 Tax=Paucisalibacillus globulus TaxID=351095 RepID=UPI000424E1C6|nr:pseudouridine synthase [Paucisalibacillus globulus]